MAVAVLVALLVAVAFGAMGVANEQPSRATHVPIVVAVAIVSSTRAIRYAVSMSG